MHSLLSIGIHLSLINARNASPQDTVTKMLCCLRRNLVTKQAGCQVVIGAVLVSSLTAAPGLSRFLQKYMGKLVGPIMIILGMFLLELLSFRNKGRNLDTKSQEKIKSKGLLGALILGSLFALTFCPVSAALFFGSVIPLAANEQSRQLIPAIYGIGTGLPVVVVSVGIAISTKMVAKMFSRIT